MRITFDARLMGPTNTRGIGRYCEELIRALLQAAPEHRYTLLVRHPEQSPFVGHSSVEHVQADVPWYGMAEQIQMPGLLARTNPDVVHVPHWNVSLLSRLPRVVTIHDLILLEEPASANITTRGPLVASVKRAGYHAALRSALTRSRELLVPTHAVADSIRRHFLDLRTPVTVTGEGMPEVPAADWSDADTEQPYLLYVGSAYPHKNLELLLQAWKEIAPRHPTLSLVFAGDLDTFMRRTEERAKEMHLPRMRFLGRVTDDELSRLYTKAIALVFPSRLEGFGLPPLEAIAHGCPVLAAQASSLPEVLGPEGAIFFQPSGTDGIVRAVETVLRDPVGARENARQQVTALRARHSWQRAALHTLEAYARATYASARPHP